MKKIADGAAYGFIVAIIILSIVSIFGVWNVFSNDVIGKSFMSIGLLAVVAIMIIVADHFIEKKDDASITPARTSASSESTAPVFKTIRTITLSTLIFSVAWLALLGILAIWEILVGDVLHKALASIAIVGFASLIIAITCLERESASNPHKKNISIGLIAVVIIVGWIVTMIVGSIL